MKFTLSWLKEHLDTDASLETIADTLTALGLEVEEVTDPSAVYAPFKVAYVEKAEQHPDADRLRVCIVDTGEEKLQVVCGAPNARTGMKGVFAPSGSHIPGTGLNLKKGMIRGQESNGMLVSEHEMALSDEHDGIIEVPEDTPVGTSFAALYGLDDPVIEIALTPDRADCTGIYGIARDLAAAGLGTLKDPDCDSVSGAFDSPITFSIEDLKGCPLFLGQYIKGVKNGPSPDWLQKKLKAVGLRPISTLVDITNYMTMTYGRPLHVYDADRLTGNIHVRVAKEGEALEALNDKAYTMNGGETMICDDSGAISIGGIVGGVSTGCEEDTVNVFVEAAYFDPMTIARTGRDLQITSDARYRFERGVDPEFVAKGLAISTKMIIELCGGEASNVVQAGDIPEWERTINFDTAYTEKLTGVDVPEERQIEILEALGFACKKDGETYTVTPPSWRGDIEGKADLAEEVVRVHGFDKIPAVSVPRDTVVPQSGETLSLTRARRSRAVLAGRGLQECVTWSFMAEEQTQMFGANDPDGQLKILNPINAEMDRMRPSILPNLIDAVRRNDHKGYADTALFEVGPVFETAKPDGQKLVAAGIRSGTDAPRHWAEDETHRTIDAFDAKTDVLSVLTACSLPAGAGQVSRDAPDWYHPGRSGAIRLGPNVLAYFGEIHPAVLEDMDTKGPLVAFEVFLDNIPPAKNKGTARPSLTLSAFQPVMRDFAFVVEQDVAAETLLGAVRGADKGLIANVSLFDVYQGKGVEDGKKSVALSVTIQPQEKTLTDAELEALAGRIVENVEKKTGGVLRG